MLCYVSRPAPTHMLLAALLFFTSIVSVMASPLDPFRWEHRILLIKAESPEVAAAYIGELERFAGEVDERDLVWFVADPDYLQTNKPEALKKTSRDQLNKLITEQTLPGERVILVGKDGGTKGRYDRLDLPAVFLRIDGMPMRRAEMER